MGAVRSIVFIFISGTLAFGAQSKDISIESDFHQKNKILDSSLNKDAENNRNSSSSSGEILEYLALNKSGQPIFDLNMLHGNRSVDIANFDSFNQIQPGKYNVDLILNGETIANINIHIEIIDDNVIPCFSKKLLSALNIDFDSISDEISKLIENLDQGSCIPLREIISGAEANFEVESLRLVVSIPQAFSKKVPRGYVNPEFWDKGINAATLRYRLGHYRNSGEFDHYSTYASVDGGLNLNGWNFRHFGYFSSQKNFGSPLESTYESINTYVEKALPKINANLILGDSFTDGAISESLGIRGIQLRSSDLMLPASLRGYAPVVRGIALTNARVEIFQNDNLIYETTVAPGPFVISDIYQSISNANLDVVVTESDGRKSSFIVPNSSMPQLVREGRFRYSIAAGKFRNSGVTTKNDLTKITAQYGISNSWTAYGGISLLKGYRAGLLGSVYETDYGAFSGDLGFSRARINIFSVNREYTGARLRFGYAELFDSTKSSVDISAYSYNNNYWSVESKVNYDEYASWIRPDNFHRDRRRLQLTFSQPLDEIGNFYLMLSKNKYWDNDQSVLNFQAGYSNNFVIKNIKFGFNLNYLRYKSNSLGNAESDRLALMLTFPLDGAYTNNLTTTFSHDRHRGNSEQVRFSGSLGDNNQLNYGLYADNMQGQELVSGGNMQYRTSAAIYDGSVSSSSRSSQLSGSFSGGVVFHSGGLTFANQLGNTLGLLYAPGAEGAIVQNSQGIEVDSKGYAVVPYLNAYQKNNVLLNTQNVSPDVNFDSTTEETIPYENAIAILKFETTIGKAALFDITRKDGTPPPFGSIAVLHEKEVGIVGQGGNTFVYGLQEQGEFYVKWGDALDQKCWVKYDLHKSKGGNTLYAKEDVSCTPF